MLQTLASTVTPNQLPLRCDPVGNLTQRTVACIEALRREAAALRMQLQVQRLSAGMNVPMEDVAELLQKAAILERGADVLARTNDELR